MGRLTARSFPDGREVRFAYDASGNLASLTPPGRPAHEFLYTPLDQREAYLPPSLDLDEHRTLYVYSPDRELVLVLRPDGRSVELDYDAEGLLASMVTGRGTTHFGYHPASRRLASIETPEGNTLAYDYDGFLLTATSWTGEVSGAVSRAYDDDFWLRSLTVAGAAPILFDYDADGLLSGAGQLAIARDPESGFLTGTALGEVATFQEYNAFGELASFSAEAGAAEVFATTYERDELGRIVTKQETLLAATRSFDYVYDLAGRLVEVHRDGALLAEYAYDANGNRTDYSGPFGTLSGVYDDQDRLVAYGELEFTYTANGELLTKSQGAQTVTYDYDELGNLLGVTLPDGLEIDYVIDAANRRIGKKVGDDLVQGFLYQDALNPIAELDGEDNLVSLFVYGSRPHVPDYMVRQGATYRIVSDHLGSPRLVIDGDTGEIAQRIDYDEFGRVILDTNPGFQPFGFAGGLYDRQTGLVRFGARDYDPEVGRWTAKDPILFAGGDTNLYGYVLADPVNLFDPEGLAVLYCKVGFDLIPPLIGPTRGREYSLWVDTGGTVGWARTESKGWGLGTPSLSVGLGVSTAPRGRDLRGPGRQGTATVAPEGGVAVARTEETGYWAGDLFTGVGVNWRGGRTATDVGELVNIPTYLRETVETVVDFAREWYRGLVRRHHGGRDRYEEDCLCP